MASDHSYKITLSNNKTEKQAIDYLMEIDKNFMLPTSLGRKQILEAFGLDKRYARTFDLLYIPGHQKTEDGVDVSNLSQITLIELKTTQKCLPNIPKGFFFGATQNEFDLAEKLGDQYKFCFISLHPDSLKYCLLSLNELNSIIVTKRVQYQINV